MTYATDKPTQPGYYWVRCIKKTEQSTYTEWRMVPFSMHGDHLDAAAGPLSIQGWDHFAGPIPEPTDP